MRIDYGKLAIQLVGIESQLVLNGVDGEALEWQWEAEKRGRWRWDSVSFGNQLLPDFRGTEVPKSHKKDHKQQASVNATVNKYVWYVQYFQLVYRTFVNKQYFVGVY